MILYINGDGLLCFLLKHDLDFQALADINQLVLDGPGGFMERLTTVADPWMRRGIRHGHTVVLTIAVCASLSGATSYMVVGRWADTLPQNILKRLSCRIGQKERCYVPPGEATLRRALQAIDIGDLCRTVALWLSDQGMRSAADSAVERLQDLRFLARRDEARIQCPPFTGGIRPFFRFLAARYERGSCMITSNLEFAQWSTVFGEERLTDALLDRLTHRCHILLMNGESYRFRQCMKRQEEGVTYNQTDNE